MSTDRFPIVGSHRRFTGLLAATLIGVYVLIVAGATTTVTDAASACTGWPTCDGRLLVPLSETELVIAWTHRAVALVVGVVLATTATIGLLGDCTRRSKALLAAAAALFAIQVGVGALTATGGAALVGSAHLPVGVAIFLTLLIALAATLEAETAGPGDYDPVDAEPIDDDPDGPAPAPRLPDGAVDRARLTLFAYFRLMKPRLMWLLSLVAAAGMALAAGRSGIGIDTILYTLGGGVLAIGASGTFNHVLERDVDRRMRRTSDRPIATDLVPVRNALAFGGLLTVGALALFLQVNLLAAALGLVAILFYSVIYTLVLKPNTVQNTVLGGAAGALPALIGWAAVEGRIGLAGLVLASVIFLWTPAHFYNLALAYKDDYARGEFPMLPVVRGEAVTMRHILYYLGATLLGASALALVSPLGVLYAATTVAVGGLFLWAVVRLHYERSEGAAFRAFHASNAYLGALLSVIVVEALVI